MQAIIEDAQFGARLDQECRPYHLRALRKKIPGLTLTDVQKQIIGDALDVALSGMRPAAHEISIVHMLWECCFLPSHMVTGHQAYGAGFAWNCIALPSWCRSMLA